MSVLSVILWFEVMQSCGRNRIIVMLGIIGKLKLRIRVYIIYYHCR
jgi:hypothetical protein